MRTSRFSSYLNLDTNAIIAYTSSLKATPVPKRKLLVCQTAFRESFHIHNSLGSIEEKARFRELIKRVKLVPDLLDQELLDLPRSRKITDNDIAIFSTGKRLGIKTVTADKHFVFACRHRRVFLDVILITSVPLLGRIDEGNPIEITQTNEP
ncbi:MAG: DUF1308 domain-containing protein [Sulfobacillus sp.]